jgi:hypothetical protein
VSAIVGPDLTADDPYPFPEGAQSVLARARGLLRPAWRTAWYASPWARAHRQARFASAGLTAPAPSLGVLAGVATDEFCRAAFTLLRRPPSPAELTVSEAEVEDAVAWFEAEGWLDDPRRYHDEPTVPDPTIDTAWVDITRWERLRFPTGWRPHPGEPGGDRWCGYHCNDTVTAHVLRHRDRPRPWLVCVHPTEMGRPVIDRRLFRAQHLHRELGLNVVLPVLPLHGPRRPGRGEPGEFPTLDPLDNVHGMAQAAADVRQVIAWVRAQEPVGVGVIGLSLGGSVVALVGGLEQALDCVIAGLPIVDFPEVFRRNAPPEVRYLPRYEALLEQAEVVHQVVSPLRFDPATPSERLFVFAGLSDRLVDPVHHAHALAEHWGRPRVHWYAGSHVGHLVERSIGRFVDDALRDTGLTDPD